MFYFLDWRSSGAPGQRADMGGIKRNMADAAERGHQATTLAELATERIGVFCWCNRCGHNATLESPPLEAELGPGFPVPEIGARLRCSGCGSKDIATRPAWPSLGQVTRHG